MIETEKLPSQIALDAIDVLRKRGHVKGIMEDDSGRVCLGGALAVAYCGNPWTVMDGHRCGWGILMKAAGDIAEEQFPKERAWRPSRPAAMAVNDHPDVTLEEVVTILEKTAISFMEQGL